MKSNSRQFSVYSLFVATLFAALFSAWARLLDFQLWPALVIIVVLPLLLAFATLFTIGFILAAEWTIGRPRRVVAALLLLIMSVLTITRLFL